MRIRYFLKIRNFSWLQFFSKISDFDSILNPLMSDIFNILISDLWVNCKSQNGILECSFVDLKDFWKFKFESKFCQKLWPLSLVKFQILTDFWTFWFLTYEWISSLKMLFWSVFLVTWKISGSLRLSQNFVKILKFFMTVVLSEISDFHQFFEHSLGRGLLMVKFANR